jgi:hypothetical protein
VFKKIRVIPIGTTAISLLRDFESKSPGDNAPVSRTHSAIKQLVRLIKESVVNFRYANPEGLIQSGIGSLKNRGYGKPKTFALLNEKLSNLVKIQNIC